MSQKEDGHRGFLGSLLPIFTGNAPIVAGGIYADNLPSRQDAPAAAYEGLKRMAPPGVTIAHGDTPGLDAFFDPRRRRVEVPHIPGLSLGVLAHEIGHAEQFHQKSPLSRLSSPLRALGSIVPGAASLGMFFTGDKHDVDRNLAGASAVAAAPKLLQELEASIRGHRLLSRLPGIGLGQKWKAYAGLPTYLAVALSPYMTMKGKEWGGWYHDKKASLPAKVRAAMQSGDFAALAAMGRAGAKSRLTKLYARRPDLLAKRGQPRPWTPPPTAPRIAPFDKVKALGEHLERPDVQHVMGWHEQDMANLLKGASKVTPEMLANHARAKEPWGRRGCGKIIQETIAKALATPAKKTPMIHLRDIVHEVEVPMPRHADLPHESPLEMMERTCRKLAPCKRLLKSFR